MPRLSVGKINPHTTLLVWKITETEEQFKSQLPESVLKIIADKNYKSKTRRLEVMATYALLISYLRKPSVIINHNSNGQPLLDGFYISISHTNGYACVLLSTQKVVAIDIEYRSDRIERIRSKFLRSDLMYNEMKVESISDSSLSMINLKTNEKKMVSYLSTPDYVLTYLV